LRQFAAWSDFSSRSRSKSSFSMPTFLRITNSNCHISMGFVPYSGRLRADLGRDSVGFSLSSCFSSRQFQLNKWY
jgi:hypothetical protein